MENRIEQLANAKYITLDEVDVMVAKRWISEATANEWFKMWCVGKCEYRWNETLNRPEVCRTDSYGKETWVRMNWS
jgi:hypothetical protein